MLAARLLGAGRRWQSTLWQSTLLGGAPGRTWAAAAGGGAGEDVELATEDERESMHFDVCIVGAGPAGLSAAIRFRQLCQEKGRDYSVCVLEKAAELGGHTLSGNVFQPTALDELLPAWRDDPDCPVRLPASRDRFYLFSRGAALRLPTPPPMKNKGNYVISLSELVRWLGWQAEAAGAEVFPGFGASKVVFHHDGSVGGVQTSDAGVARDGSRKDSFTLGMALTARATLFAEGCRGSLSQEVIKHFGLAEAAGAQPQTYALGIKEVWEVDPSKHAPGTVWHSVGYPLPWDVYGGSWLYHMEGNKVSLGLVVGLDYADPYLNPYQEFQRWKAHPRVAALLEGGTCLQYGARALVEGGLQSLPVLSFPGGALLGDAAGTLVVSKIKGTHTAMKSGMLAAEAAFAALEAEAPAPHAVMRTPLDLSRYGAAVEGSWVHEELRRARNVRPSFGMGAGLYGGLALSALDALLLRGNAPWTLRHRQADHERLRPAEGYAPRHYPKPDGKLTFDLATSLYRSGTNHNHDQPPHLRLRNPKLPTALNLPTYAGPETRYCPAGVYEYVTGEGGAPRLQINAQNCLHCKACDIKDPAQNIHWTTPEGGGGPSYTIT